MINSNRYSQRRPEEQGQNPVGRIALIPTSIYRPKHLIVQWLSLCQYYLNKEQLFYASLRRDEGNLTYGFLDIKSLSAKLCFLPILFCGALKTAPYKIQKHYNLTYFSRKLLFNVKITPYKHWSHE